jgi:chemotaxis protein CheD
MRFLSPTSSPTPLYALSARSERVPSAPLPLALSRLIIGIGELAISAEPRMILSTYALGACLGVIAYEPQLKVGGIIHIMLPDSTVSTDKALKQPAMFADTGLPLFFRELAKHHVDRTRLRLFIAGGAGIIRGSDPIKIGTRNLAVTLAYLKAHSLSISHQETGGSINRTVHLDLSTGTAELKTPDGSRPFQLGG